MYVNMNEPFVSRKTLDDMPEEKKQYKKTKRKKVLFEILFYGLIFFLIIYLVPVHLAERIVIQGKSMEPTLYDNESVLIEKVSVSANSLERYDIIVFRHKDPSIKDYVVKRIIGLPGETVQIISGSIYINGVKIADSYAKDHIMTNAGNASEPLLLNAGEYFVLGDNREISSDSRSSQIGIVNYSQIVGVVKAVIWPLKNFRFVD